MESIELGDVKADGKVRSCKQKQDRQLTYSVTLARSFHLSRHGNATVRSVRIVELLLSSVLEKRSIVLQSSQCGSTQSVRKIQEPPPNSQVPVGSMKHQCKRIVLLTCYVAVNSVISIESVAMEALQCVYFCIVALCVAARVSYGDFLSPATVKPTDIQM